MSVSPIPDGHHAVIPYLSVRDAAQAIEFYRRALGAVPGLRMAEPGGRIRHAELRVGDARFMLADESPEHGSRSPQQLGGTPVGLLLYVADVDAVFNRAVAAGATIKRAVQDQFYGDRSGSIEDPFGHVWHLATRIEEVSEEEMRARMAMLSGLQQQPRASAAAGAQQQQSAQQ